MSRAASVVCLEGYDLLADGWDAAGVLLWEMALGLIWWEVVGLSVCHWCIVDRCVHLLGTEC